MEGNEESGVQYLIAANSKRAQLIFNAFRPIDLTIEIIGLVVTFVLFLTIQPSNLWIVILVLLPGATTTFLVLPIPNYQMSCV